MKKIFEKHPLIKYIVTSYTYSFLYACIVFLTAFLLLQCTGTYTKIETALNLKYNSPFVIAPLYGFIALAVICFVVGFLLYFYKYKRSKSKTAFYKAFSEILNEKQGE